MGQLTDTNESLSESVMELKLGHREDEAKRQNELYQLREDNSLLKARLIKLIKYGRRILTLGHYSKTTVSLVVFISAGLR